MHAYLFIGNKDLDKRISEFASEKDALVISFNLNKIEDVRSFIKFSKLKANKTQVVVLEKFDDATTEAQNSFLKSLEEPQDNLYYLLCCLSVNTILPTIRSRCQIIKLGYQAQKDADYAGLKFDDENIDRLFTAIKEINAKEEALVFLENVIAHEHQNITGKNPKYYFSSKIINSASDALTNIKMNANVKIQLAKFVLDLV